MVLISILQRNIWILSCKYLLAVFFQMSLKKCCLNEVTFPAVAVEILHYIQHVAFALNL